jgi:carboxymethylenebutenolidase
MRQAINIQTEGGEFSAYLATPDKFPAPAVVVLHEVFGVNEDIRQTCRELARAGFIAVAPELFWRQERGVDLNSWSEEEWKKGLALYTAYDRNIGVRDILAAVRAAKQLQGATGKVGVMGFCLGGLMTYLTAARHHLDVAVTYHGGDTESYLDEAKAIAAPLMMHLAEEDEYISRDAQRRIRAALTDVPGAQVYGYPGQNHAFARHTGVHYNANAAAVANSRTIAVLAEHLGLANAR